MLHAETLRNTIRRLAVFATFLLVAPSLHAQGLSPDERKLQERVGASFEDACALLERVVNINSGTMNPDGVRQVGAIFRTEFDRIGFQTRWLDMPKETMRAGHLSAERKGTRGKKLLLIGHLDTVFERDSPFQKFSRKGDKAYGPGVGDMKSGNVVMLFALKALHDLGLLDGSTVTVAMTGDEEKPGQPISTVRGELVAAAKRSDVALEFEGSVGPNNATVARRGSSTWMLTVKGKAGHSGRIFSREYGSGAIFEAARILDSFYRELAGEQYLVLNPGVIIGGTSVEYDPEKASGKGFGKTNVIPENVTVHGGLRCISEEQQEKVRARMKAIVAKNLPETSASIAFEDGYPAMAPTAGNKALLEIYDKASRDLGLGAIIPLDPAERGAGDISFVAPFIDCLSGLGPVGGGSHSVAEDLDLKSLRVALQRTAILLYRLTR
jgi:glutamate carboxypeptidase